MFPLVFKFLREHEAAAGVVGEAAFKPRTLYQLLRPIM